jgi:hypothetical protein
VSGQPPPPQDPDFPTELERLRAALVVGDAICKIPPPDPLVEGLLDLDSLGYLYGPAGSMKTFVAVDLACCVASGTLWQGRKTVTVPVLYCVAESPGGVGQRVVAWRDAHLDADIGQLTWLTLPPNLASTASANALVDLVRELGSRLVVLDTLARCMTGADENSAKDMGSVIAACDRVRRATSACLLGIHHTGRDLERGLRGSTALEAGCDTALEARKAGDLVAVVAKRQRNRVGGDAFHLRFVPQGRSGVLVGAADEWAEGPPDQARRMLRVLHEMDEGDGVTSSNWRKTCDIPERTFYRLRGSLVDKGLVERFPHGRAKHYQLTDAGLGELAGDKSEEAF